MPAKPAKNKAVTPPKALKTAKPLKPVAKEAGKTSPRKKRPPGKSSAKLPPGFSLEPKKAPKEPVLSHDDISLRAYFISERRHKMGLPGNPATDWADAVSQLRAEALEKPLRKR